jgi:hypothetical protein
MPSLSPDCTVSAWQIGAGTAGLLTTDCPNAQQAPWQGPLVFELFERIWLASENTKSSSVP